MITACISCNNF